LLAWIALVVAVAAEVCGTLMLRGIASQFDWRIAVLVLAAYATSFGCLALCLRHVNVGVAYAIWSAVGTAATSTAGAVLFGDRLTPVGVSALVIIVFGVALLAVSGSVTH
jgi:small multidrug resistance pump